jgi:microcystin-dependent protein
LHGTIGRECVLREVWLVAGTLGRQATPADGRIIPIGSNPQLYGVIGSLYGGDAASNTSRCPTCAMQRRTGSRT